MQIYIHVGACDNYLLGTRVHANLVDVYFLHRLWFVCYWYMYMYIELAYIVCLQVQYTQFALG